MKYLDRRNPYFSHHIPFIQPALYKYCLILLAVFTLAGCLSGKRPAVRLSPKLDKKLYQITSLPLTVGLYIEPDLRNYVQKAPLKQYETPTPYYVFPDFIFPIGRPLSSKIEEMSNIIFQRVVFVDNLQDKEYLNKQALDGVLAVRLKNSEIELRVDVSVWRAIGRHNLSLMASFLDPKLDKIWESEVAVEGKGLDFVTTKVEHEWWITSGPNFAPAVDEAIQKVTYELAQKIITSEEISNYINKEKP